MRPLLRLAIALFIMLSACDFLTTRKVLELGGVELNPYVRPFTNNPYTFLTWFIVATAIGVLLIVALYVWVTKAESLLRGSCLRKFPEALWIAVVLYILAMKFLCVVNNIIVIAYKVPVTPIATLYSIVWRLLGG